MIPIWAFTYHKFVISTTIPLKIPIHFSEKKASQLPVQHVTTPSVHVTHFFLGFPNHVSSCRSTRPMVPRPVSHLPLRGLGKKSRNYPGVPRGEPWVFPWMAELHRALRENRDEPPHSAAGTKLKPSTNWNSVHLRSLGRYGIFWKRLFNYGASNACLTRFLLIHPSYKHSFTFQATSWFVIQGPARLLLYSEKCHLCLQH